VGILLSLFAVTRIDTVFSDIFGETAITHSMQLFLTNHFVCKDCDFQILRIVKQKRKLTRLYLLYSMSCFTGKCREALRLNFIRCGKRKETQVCSQTRSIFESHTSCHHQRSSSFPFPCLSPFSIPVASVYARAIHSISIGTPFGN